MMCLLNNKMAAVSAANVQFDNDASGPDSWAVSIPGEPPARGLPVGSTTVNAAAATIIYSDGSAASLQHLASTMETTMTKAKGCTQSCTTPIGDSAASPSQQTDIAAIADDWNDETPIILSLVVRARAIARISP
jgi:hypothetical protein